MKDLKSLFEKIRRIEITTGKLVEELMQGAYRSAFKGRGLEFDEVRPYQPQDEVRTIDWNVTARLNHPYIKEFTEERQLTVMLVIDMSSSSHFGTRKRTKQELIAEISAMLAFSAIKNRDKVGAVLFTDRIEKYIPPKQGTRHVLRVIRDLLELECQGSGTDIGKAMEFLGKVQKKSAVCFIISDFITNKPYSSPLKILAKKHDVVAIGIRDPAEVHPPIGELTFFQNIETGKSLCVDLSDAVVQESFQETVKEQQSMLKQLMGKIGGGYISLQTDEPYEAAFREYFKTRRARM